MDRLLFGALLSLVLGLAAFFYGVGVGADRERAKVAEELVAAQQEARRIQGELDIVRRQATLREFGRQETVREIYRDVPTIVDRPVYAGRCLDPDGVRLLDRAAAAANGDDRPEPAGAATEIAADPAGG